MNREPLRRVAGLVQQAMQEAGVFRRSGGGALLEQEFYRPSSGPAYIALGAGLEEADARRFFPNNKARARKSLRSYYPLELLGGGSASILLCLRPLREAEEALNHEVAAPFCPADPDLARVAVGASWIRLMDLDSWLGVHSLRWEFDLACQDGVDELWLREWLVRLNENPAHPRSHLHINSGGSPLSRHASARSAPAGGKRPPAFDLRLAIGFPNPLTFILSFAAWRRRPMT